MSKNLYSEWYMQNDKGSKRIRTYIKIMLVLLILALTIYSFSSLNLKLNSYGLKIFNNNIKNIFSFSNSNPNYPNFTMINISLKLMWITIRVTLLGTFLGYIFSIISSFFGSNHFNKIIFKGLSNFIIIILRSMPLIFIVYLFQDAFNKELCAVFIITWFTWLWCHKNMIIIFNNQNILFYKRYVEQKYSRLYAFKINYIKRVNNRMMGLFFYSFESNIRWATILSTFGIIGIGDLIINNQDFYYYSGIPLLVLFIFLVIMEIINVIIYKYLLIYKSRLINKGFIEWRTIFKKFLILIVFSIVLYQTIIMKWEIEISGLKKLEHLFKPNISNWSMNNFFNPWYGIGRLVLDAIIAMTICLIVGIILAILGNNVVNKLPKSLFFRCFSIFIKIIPITIILLILNPLFWSLSSWINLIIGIYAGIALSKQLIDTINKIKFPIIYKLQLRGYSKSKIIFKFIIPSIKSDLIYYGFLSFENILRNLIILGVLGSSFAGSQLVALQERNKYLVFAGYIWAIYILYFVTEMCFILITYLLKRKNYVKNL